MRDLKLNDVKFLFILIIIISVFLRLININSEQLWHDEAISIYIAKLQNDDFLSSVINDIHPPLYYIILRGWIYISGDSVFSCRLLSVIFSVLTLPILYFLGKSLKNEKFGILLCFFHTISPFSIYFANEVRSYSLLSLIFTISLYFSLKCLKNPNKIKFYCYLGISSMLLIYTHYIGVIYVGSLYFGLIFINIRKKLNLKYLLTSFLISILFYIPWFPYAIEDFINGVPGYAGGRLNLINLIYWVFYLLVAPIPSDITNPYVFNLIIMTLLISIPLILFSFICFLGFLYFYKNKRTNKKNFALKFLFLIMALIFGITIILGFLIPNSFTAKNLIGGLNLVYIIYSFGFYYYFNSPNFENEKLAKTRIKLNSKKLQKGLLILVFSIGIISLTIFPIFKNQNLQKSDWDGCIKKLKTENKETDIIIISYGGNIPPVMDYYSNLNDFNLSSEIYDLNYNSAEILAFFNYISQENITRIWIVNFWLHIRDPNYLTQNLIIEPYNLTVLSRYNFRLNISLVLLGF